MQAESSVLPTIHSKGRGAQLNPANKFLHRSYNRQITEAIDDWTNDAPNTEYFCEHSKTLVNEISSPDLGMRFSANPYQGCEHGCIYCYARNTHEYWGYSAGLDFESKIVIKHNAPQLLRKFFSNKRYVPATLSLSGNTDCYQPIERQTGITAKLLEICLEYRNPVGIITKNALVLRDLPILKELAGLNLVRVFISITSLDEELRRNMEPRTSTYQARLKVIKQLSDNGIPCGVMNAPIIPGLNDKHIHDVLQAAAQAGAKWAGYTMLRLNGAVGGIFHDWLHKTYPDAAAKIWNLICSCHNGKVSDSRFGKRMSGDGKIALLIKDQFELYCRKFKLNESSEALNTADFRRLKNGQLALF